MHAGDPQRDAETVGRRAQIDAALGQLGGGAGQPGMRSGLELHLAGDQLAGQAIAQRGLCRGEQVLIAVHQTQGHRIEDLKLLLETDREIGRGGEALAHARKDGGGLWPVAHQRGGTLPAARVRTAS